MSKAAANKEHPPTRMEKALLAADTKRVFIAEGDPFMRRLLVRKFESEGHHVIAAENGSVMLDYMFEMPRPTAGSRDVLITDVDMPEIGGLELVDRARAVGWTLPVVFIIGNPSAEVVRLSQERKAVRCLAKPFSLGELVGTVDRLAK